MERKTYLKLAALFLLIIYAVGRFGLVSSHSMQFVDVTWLNLVITAILTFAFQRNINSEFIVRCFSIFCAGFLIEWLGVATGKIFGEYTYGQTLGLKIAGIPLLIGLNWLVLVYAVSNITNCLKVNKLWSIIVGALLLVLLDFFMEPFAIRFDMWSWHNSIVPLQNYIAWFVVSLLMLWFLHPAQRKMPLNYFAVFVYFLQLFFFASFFLH